MSALILTLQRHGVSWLARLASLIELTKPRIAVMVLAAVAVASYVASLGHVTWVELVHAMLGTLLVAGSASAMNQAIERRLDARMPRTQNRPLPAGRLAPLEVIAFGGLLFLCGEVYLLLLVNAQTAFWGLVTWLLYVAVYTPLKTRTSANTAVGAIPGALPIVMGWTATGQSIDIQAGAIFLMVYLWQFPHFMAIAWLYRDHYAAADMKMLTVANAKNEGPTQPWIIAIVR